MNKLLEAFANIFRVPDLRKRLLFTLGLLAVYRLGGHIPTPGINIQRWEALFNSQAGSIFGFFDLFAGGNSICSPAAISSASRSSHWASCRTLRRRLFFSC